MKKLFFVQFFLCAAIVASAQRKESWIKRANKLSSRAISKEEIQQFAADEDRDTRNKISLRRIKPRTGKTDWDTDPTAIPFMLYQVKMRTGLPVHVNNDGLDVASEELFEHTAVYLTSHYNWSFDDKETANLKNWLQRGGTLYLDDCYNKGSPFTDSVQPEVGKMIPGGKPEVLIKNDKKVSDVFRMLYPMSGWPGESLETMRPWQYFLLADRPAVFFSPNDDGCGWEISTPPSASNPIGEGIGHGGGNAGRERFYQWMTSWMMYIYCH